MLNKIDIKKVPGFSHITSQTTPSVQWEQYSDSSREEVNTFIKNHPHGMAFHMPAWREAVSEVYGGSDISIIARNEQGAIAGFLPLWARKDRYEFSITSAPFAHYASPLVRLENYSSNTLSIDVNINSETVLSFLIASMKMVTEACRPSRFELRGLADIFGVGVIDPKHSQYQLDLSGGLEAVWKRASGRARNRKRKAEKHNLAVSRGKEGLPVFYEIYVLAMHFHGTPCHTKRLFEVLSERFGDDFDVQVAWSPDHSPVAAQILIRCGSTMSYPWQSAIREKMWLCPNDLLMWKLIERSVELNCTAIDMGRSARNSYQSYFKEKWGGIEHRLRLHSIPERSSQSFIERFEQIISNIWRCLPVMVTYKFGPYLRKHFP